MLIQIKKTFRYTLLIYRAGVVTIGRAGVPLASFALVSFVCLNIFFNASFLVIFNYMVKYLIFYFSPIYILLNFLLKKNAIFCLISPIIILCANLLELCDLGDPDLNADNIFGDIMCNNMVLADLVDSVRNMYCLLKYKLCKIFYKDICTFADDKSNDNGSDVRYDLSPSNTYWGNFLNFISSVQSFFIKRVISSYHFSTNILFNELDVCLKNIFNFFNGAGEKAANKANIAGELNGALTKLRAMQNNYIYIYTHSRTYADHKYDYDFYFELASNLSYQKLRLEYLHNNIKRLEDTVALGLGFDLDINSKIKQVQISRKLLRYSILEFEKKKFYSYYMVEQEVN
jgi:hypothetical protein